jgi:hypothetical protein
LGGIPRNSIANFVNMGSETINRHLRISSRIFGLQLPCPWSVPNVLSTSKEEATTMTAMKSNSIHATLGSSTWGLSQTHYWKNALAGVLNGVTHLWNLPLSHLHISSSAVSSIFSPTRHAKLRKKTLLLKIGELLLMAPTYFHCKVGGRRLTSEGPFGLLDWLCLKLYSSSVPPMWSNSANSRGELTPPIRIARCWSERFFTNWW